MKVNFDLRHWLAGNVPDLFIAQSGNVFEQENLALALRQTFRRRLDRAPQPRTHGPLIGVVGAICREVLRASVIEKRIRGLGWRYSIQRAICRNPVNPAAELRLGRQMVDAILHGALNGKAKKPSR